MVKIKKASANDEMGFERGLVIIPWVLKTSKSWNNDPERVFQYQ